MRLNVKKATKVYRFGIMKCFMSNRTDFVFNTLSNFEPVQGFKDRCDVREFGSRDNSTSERILNALKAIKLIFRKVVVERVAVIKFRMHE